MQAVIPSCAAASMIVSSFMPLRAALEDAEVAACASSLWRLAPMSENSMTTKNALRTIKSTVTANTPSPLIANHPLRSRRVLPHPDRPHESESKLLRARVL